MNRELPGLLTVQEQCYYSVVRLETTELSGKTFEETAFAFSLSHNGQSHQFLTTAKHNVKDAQVGRVAFLRAEGLGNQRHPVLGDPYFEEIRGFKQWWSGHADPEVDVAVAPLGALLQRLEQSGVDVFLRSLHEGLIPRVGLDLFDVIEEILFVGYPAGAWDSVNHLPIVRRGSTAAPYDVDYRGRSQFLVDAAVVPGSSGSPVFIHNAGSYPSKMGGLVLGTRLFFLGMTSQAHYRNEQGELAIPGTEEMFRLKTPQLVNLGIAVKARAILEAARWRLSHPEMTFSGSAADVEA